MKITELEKTTCLQVDVKESDLTTQDLEDIEDAATPYEGDGVIVYTEDFEGRGILPRGPRPTKP